MNSAIERLLTLRVGDVMNDLVVKIDQQTTMGQAAAVFEEYDISGVPVVDNDGKCIGVLSVADFAYRERQLAVASAWSELSSQPTNRFESGGVEHDHQCVTDYMSPVVQTVSKDAPIMNAARLLVGEHLHRLVIVDDDERPIGILSSLDLVGCMIVAVEE